MMPVNDELILPRRLAVRLLHAAQLEPAREVCGLVSARDGEPCRFWPVANVSPTPERAFEMAADEQLAAMRRLREAGETLWAVFHSHPSAPAEPSARDIREAGYPEALMLIASLGIRGVLELRAWELRGNAPAERPLRIRD